MNKEEKERLAKQLFDKAKDIELGKGTGKPDPDGAVIWYKNAAEYGSTDAMMRLGSIYYDRQEYKRAYHWTLEAALAGETTAWHNLGVFYLFGSYVTQDYEKAYQYFLKAYRAGEMHSCFYLG